MKIENKFKKSKIKIKIKIKGSWSLEFSSTYVGRFTSFRILGKINLKNIMKL